jgi:hypothetical protein
MAFAVRSPLCVELSQRPLVILFLLLCEHRTPIVLAYKFIILLVDGACMYYVLTFVTICMYSAA